MNRIIALCALLGLSGNLFGASQDEQSKKKSRNKFPRSFPVAEFIAANYLPTTEKKPNTPFVPGSFVPRSSEK